ncbi:MAG TPA: hypothetical protein VEQ58_00725 [Polyangiaceae bacterium]|nr:hypothetical protein [Polyangiaceae bacterium]
MFRFVSHTLAFCGAALVALLPATSHADTVSFSTHLLPAMWHRQWAPLLRLDRVAHAIGVATPMMALGRAEPSRTESQSFTALRTTRLLPLSIDPTAAAWWSRPSLTTPMKLELSDAAALAQEQASSETPALPSVPYGMPALLRYSNEDTNVALSISPGSPCTGACLKVEGSF